MKNKKLLLLGFLVFFFSIFTVNAKEIVVDDIPNRSYVIGTYIFKPGTAMTSKKIMWAARSIKPKPGQLEITMDDMEIFYKNSNGKWMDVSANAPKEVLAEDIPETWVFEYEIDGEKETDIRDKVEDIIITAKVAGNDYVVGNALPNNEGVQISLSTLTADAEIFYTLDGSEVTTSSNRYTESFVVDTEKASGETITIKVLATKDAYIDSTEEITIIFSMKENVVFNQTTAKVYDDIETAIREADNGNSLILGAGVHDLSQIKYINLVDNLTIVGTEGATLKGPRLDGTNQFNAYMGNGLTFRNVKFVDDRLIIDLQNIRNLVIDNCTFANGAYLQIGPNAGNTAENITIKNSTFEGVAGKTSILIQSRSKNINLENNTINNAGYNAIQITKIEGDLKIDGNRINGAVSAAVRVATLDGASLTIVNNAMTATNTDGKYPGEVIRISGAVIDGNLTGNTSDGEIISFENGIGKTNH